MKQTLILFLASIACSCLFTSCETLGPTTGGGLFSDSVNDASLYRSQDRTFRNPQ